MCRRAAGAPVVAWLTMPAAGFRFTRGAPARYDSSDIAFREFCPGCGTQLTYRAHAKPHEVDITSATLVLPGREIPIGVLPTDGRGLEIPFSTQEFKTLTLKIKGASGSAVGLAEIEVVLPKVGRARQFLRKGRQRHVVRWWVEQHGDIDIAERRGLVPGVAAVEVCEAHLRPRLQGPPQRRLVHRRGKGPHPYSVVVFAREASSPGPRASTDALRKALARAGPRGHCGAGTVLWRSGRQRVAHLWQDGFSRPSRLYREGCAAHHDRRAQGAIASGRHSPARPGSDLPQVPGEGA